MPIIKVWSNAVIYKICVDLEKEKRFHESKINPTQTTKLNKTTYIQREVTFQYSNICHHSFSGACSTLSAS